MRHTTGLMLCSLVVALAALPLVFASSSEAVAITLPIATAPPLAPTQEPTATPMPTVAPVLIMSQGVPMYVRVSHYWPKLGGVNCSNFVNGECISKMASGEKWEDWVDRAAACPPEWPFGATIELDGKTWTCMDRGGKVKFVAGVPWVDLLQEVAGYPYGAITYAVVAVPLR